MFASNWPLSWAAVGFGADGLVRQLGKIRLNSVGSDPSSTRTTGVDAAYFF